MKQHVKAIEKALKRLAASKTKVTRANAKAELSRAIRELERAVMFEYPNIRKDGTLVTVNNKKGRVCPICDVPMKTPTTLATHLVAKHFCGCPCGFVEWGQHGPGDRQVTMLARHLAGLKDIKTHFAEHNLRKAAGL